VAFFSPRTFSGYGGHGAAELKFLPTPLVWFSQYDQSMIKGMTCKAWEPTADRP